MGVMYLCLFQASLFGAMGLDRDIVNATSWALFTKRLAEYSPYLYPPVHKDTVAVWTSHCAHSVFTISYAIRSLIVRSSIPFGTLSCWFLLIDPYLTAVGWKKLERW